jgi:uncharacterized repeat protein (TIGR01451 family)
MKTQKRKSKNARRRRHALGYEMRSALFQPLEERLMLDIGGANSLPPTIVVGRTLSAYDVPDVKNNQETLTFTVYNQADHPISGVLLTDTFENGVTFASASQLPDQNGQQLAWSLGTIQPYDRASVTLTVDLTTPTPTQLDTGASAYGTLDAGMVTWSTAPATLRTTAIAANLLASTPDANTTDPYVQEVAAQLNYDPNKARFRKARPSSSSSRCSRRVTKQSVTSHPARRFRIPPTTRSFSPKPNSVTGSNSTPAAACKTPTR